MSPNNTLTIGVTTEEEIVDVLASNTFTREYLFLAVRLVSDDYDAARLISLAKKREVFHKLGYLSELILDTIRSNELPFEEDRLREIVLAYMPPTTIEHLVKDYHPPLVEIQRQEMRPLNRKWGIIGTLQEEDVYRYIEMYLGAGVK